MRVMVKTSFGDVVVALNPAIDNSIIHEFLLYVNAGKYDGQPFGQDIIQGDNYYILFTAWNMFNQEYSIDGNTVSGQSILDAIAAGANPPPETEPNIATVLTVEYIVENVPPAT